MKITSIPQIYRNVRRWTEIITVLSKYGLADWISTFKLEFIKDALKARDGEAIARHTREARIRLALTELGPTFIKLGQLLSTRPDVVGVQLADELAKLQSNVPADPPDKIRASITEELGQPVEELFAEFIDEPIASASIGQVHAARLATGEDVVVKVQHLGIESVVREDLDVLGGLAQLAEMIPEFSPYRPSRPSLRWRGRCVASWTLAEKNATCSSLKLNWPTIRSFAFRNRSRNFARLEC